MMKDNGHFRNLGLILLLWCVGACVRKPIFPKEDAPKNLYEGILILNEGLWQQNNASLSFHNTNTQETQHRVFYTVNGENLGDTATDLCRVGDTLFIVVSTSNTLYKVNKNTLKLYQQLVIPNGGDLRKMVYVNPQKAYISALTGKKVWIINPQTMQVTGSFSASFPEQMRVINQKLYITQSNYPPNVKNDKILVYEVINDQYVGEIRLDVENATHLAVGANQQLWVVSTGNYTSNLGLLSNINPQTQFVEAKIPIPDNPTHVIEVQDTIFVMNDKGIVRYIPKTSATPQLWIDKTAYLGNGELFYNFYFDTLTQQWFVACTKQFVYDGEILVFNRLGQLKYRFASKLNPSVMLRN